MTTIMHLEGGVVVNLGEAKGQYQYLSQEFNRRGLSSHHWSVLTNLYQKAEAATALRSRVAELESALKMLIAHCEAGLDDESDLEFARAAIAGKERK